MKPENQPIRWGLRALKYAIAITGLSAGRGSATQAEAQAASFVQKSLQNLGMVGVRLQPFSGLRSLWLFLSLVFGLGIVGHAAFWLLQPVSGDLVALVFMVLAFGSSGFLLWRKFTFREFPLRWTLPHGPSQNVIAILPPTEEKRQQVVLIAHLDSHRAVFWFASDFLVRLFALSSPVSVYGVYLAPALYILNLLSGWSVFAWVGAILAFFHFMAWFTGLTADLGPYSPGANDNAAAVGTVLTLAERLKEQPLNNTEAWLVFTGCEESGCDGITAFFKEYRQVLKNALILDFELVGIGDQLVYLRREGVIRRRTIDPHVEKLVQQVGKEFRLRPVSVQATGAFTEAGAAWEHDLKAVCLLAKSSASPLMPEWHRLTDRPERLEASTLERVHELAWAILKRFDEEASR